MTETENGLRLSPFEQFPLMEDQKVYRLETGRIQVYILSEKNGEVGAPCLYCEIRDTDRFKAIPTLSYVDEAQIKWFLSITSADEGAVLSLTPGQATSIPYKNFLKKNQITTFDSLGYGPSLAAYYKSHAPAPAAFSQVIVPSTMPYLTESDNDAYRLEKGKVFVYIVPMEKGRPGKAQYYCDVADTDSLRTIPGFVYQDNNFKRWRFQFKSATDEAVFSVIPGGATDGVQQSFLQRQGITSFAQEGFHDSLVEFYTQQIVKDVGFIRKSGNTSAGSQKRIVNVLKDTFSDVGQSEYTGNAYYQALQFISKRMDIPLIKAEEIPSRCGKNPGLMDIATASHFICRKIVLDAGWFRSDCGCFVGTLDKEVIACAPDKNGKYQVFRSSDESVAALTPELAQQISPQAYSVGRTLPLKPLKKKDIYGFCKKSIYRRDLIPYIILVVFCALIGVLLPTLNKMIYDDYIPVGNIGNLTQLCLVMLTFMIGNVTFSIVKNLFGYRVTSRVGNDLQNAVFHRLFHLPESFFRDYDSADLANRVSSIGATASRYANTLVISSISALFSLFYLIRMLTYNGKLTWVGVGIYAAYLVVISAIVSTARKGRLRVAEAESAASGKLYQYLNGVDKLRMAGVEDQALLSYMQPYSKQQFEEIRINRLVSIEEALATVIKSIFSMLLYWYIVKKVKVGNISVGTFIAFNTAFGSFTGALDSLVEELLQLFQEREEIKRFWPVFDTVPEDDDSKEVPGPLSGGITLEHVTFAYQQGAKNVLTDLSMDIKPGEYVGIVGPSGCGKSTLLKLLLGFESPQSGMVMVDKKDLRSVNKGAYRRQLGVVLQNGKLISGSIFENITITAPDTTMARVQEVVAQVGLKDDIAQMPMGLHTMLSENCNTISGGQQQRILIARAICGSPRILIFDEATSALDNMTQAAVSSSLDKMHVTRIVVAHRLSTIKNCDRIFVLDGGEIKQEGTYDSLMEDKNGLFYQLASRQLTQ